MKNGIKTSEAWLTLASVIVGLLLAYGAINQEEHDTLKAAIPDIVKGLAAAVIIVGPVWKYISGRVTLKLKELELMTLLEVYEIQKANGPAAFPEAQNVAPGPSGRPH